MAKQEKKVLWFGITPIIPLSERSNQLVGILGNIYVCYPDNTRGMMKYTDWQTLVEAYEIIATDQKEIDSSWEKFFTPENKRKKIYCWDGSKWNELKPGFSK